MENKHILQRGIHSKLCSIVFIFGVIVMLSSISVSAWTSDSFIKDYDKIAELQSTTQYGKYIIEKSSWYDPLQIWTKRIVQEIELQSNTDSCGNFCEEIQNITLYEDGVLIEDRRYTRIYEDGTRELSNIRSDTFFIQTGVTEKFIEDYEYKCSETGKLNVNGTKEISCSNVKVGSHIEQTPEWTQYNVGDIVPSGNYIVKHTGEKRADWTYDWEIKTGGIWTSNWAVWGAGGEIGVGLVGYWDFENNTERKEGIMNLTPDDGQVTFQTSSLNGKAGLFDDTHNMFISNTMSGTNFDFPINSTLSFWANRTGGVTFFHKRASGTGWFMSDSGNLQISSLGSSQLDTSLSTNIWTNYVIRTNDTHISIWKNGLIDDFATRNVASSNLINFTLGSGTSIGEGDYVGEFDEIGIWNRSLSASEISDLYNSGSGLFYNNLIGGLVTLNSPGDNFISPSVNILFNASATQAGATIVNMSLYTNQSGVFQQENVTTGLSGLTNTTTWDHNLGGDGTYLWNVQACDSDGDCGFSPLNRTVSVDATAPSISILTPGTTISYGYENKNESLNYSIADAGTLSSCWFNYNDTSTNTTIPCTTNTTFLLGDFGNKTLTMYANDSANNINSSSVTWDYSIWENSRSFNSLTTEGATEPFTLNFTQFSGIQTSTVNLVYNGTANPSIFTITNNEVIASNSITIPDKTTSIMVPFYWSILLSSGSTINTTESNQTINVLQMDNCSTFTEVVYNYTIYDEETQIQLNNATIEVQLNLFNSEKTVQILSFSQTYSNTNNATICLNNSLLNTVNYSANSVVKYNSNESLVGNASRDYATEYYHILGQVITNSTIPKNIKLYNLNQDDATEFQLTFKDASLVLAPNILVNVYRQYVADNDFKVVEIPLTDSSGQTILHLVRNDIIYNLVMVDANGVILATFNKVTAFCKDFTIGECTINLNAPSDIDTLYDYTSDLGISFTTPTFSNITNLVTTTFTSLNLSTITVRMDIIRNGEFGNRTACTDSLTSATGTLSCNVSSIISTDRFLFVEMYVEGDLKQMLTIDLQQDSFNFGIVNGAFYSFLLILFIITMFMDDKQTLIVALVIGWAGIIAMGLIKGALFGAASAGIWLIVSAIIMLWKLKEEED